MELLRKKFGEDFKEYWQEGYEGFYGNLQKEPGHVIRNEEYFTLGKSIFYRGSYELRREREWEGRGMTCYKSLWRDRSVKMKKNFLSM